VTAASVYRALANAARGVRIAEIAARLFLSDSTVPNYRRVAT
jgi:hypothetical protein